SSTLRMKFNTFRNVAIDINVRSFVHFSRITLGIYKKALIITELFDDLVELGAGRIYDLYISSLKYDMGDITPEYRLNRLEILLTHYHNQSLLDRTLFFAETATFERKELGNILSISPFLSDEIRKEVESEIQRETTFTIRILCMEGTHTDYELDRGAYTTIGLLKKAIEDRQNISMSRRNLFYGETPLVNERMIGDYNIS
ncbi:hypothetical protein PFISCL1PPCAC_4828, partial [Pristionchus fissidentatus]